MRKQIKPGYYLAFQTHSESEDKGRWFVKESPERNQKWNYHYNERSFAVDFEKNANNNGYMYFNYSLDKYDKASFGWRVKSVKN